VAALLRYIGLIVLLSGLFACNRKGELPLPKREKHISIRQQVPKALFITTGVDLQSEEKNIPSDVAVALHAFHRAGVPVRLAPRDILWNPDSLARYAYLILSTSEGVHDADRKYSLSYLTTDELEIIKEYVRQGGVLIAGDNIGRNDFEGKDRILKTGKLEPVTYPLAEVFGYTAVEKNLRDYAFRSSAVFKNETIRINGYDLWMPVADSILSKDLRILAYWIKDNDSVPAITYNQYGKGLAISLSLSGFLKPAAANGLFSAKEIMDFYFFADSLRDPQYRIRIYPWPGGAGGALSLTFNPADSMDNTGFLVNKLKSAKIPATFFVNGNRENEKIFHHSKAIELASTGYAYINYDEADYGLAVKDIKQNEFVWHKKFRGFRFPFTNPAAYGVEVLRQNAYQYESSVSVNNFNRLEGANVPYNLVVSDGERYFDSGLWECPPVWHDDYFFLHDREQYAGTPGEEKRLRLMRQFLLDYWEQTVRPVNGAMVFIAHPGLSGYDARTFSVLDTLIKVARSENVWITTLGEMQAYKRALAEMPVSWQKKGKKIRISLPAPPVSLEGFTLILSFKPAEVHTSSGQKIAIREKDGNYFLTFDLKKALELEITL